MSMPTPLDDIHRLLGATMTDFAGWSIPLRYTSELAEHQAVRTAAGLFDLSHMGEIEVIGSDAAHALDCALVGDIGAIADHKAKYTLLCRDDGGIVDDLIVYRLSRDRFLVVANAANAETVLLELRQRCATFPVRVLDNGRNGR